MPGHVKPLLDRPMTPEERKEVEEELRRTRMPTFKEYMLLQEKVADLTRQLSVVASTAKDREVENDQIKLQVLTMKRENEQLDKDIKSAQKILDGRLEQIEKLMQEVKALKAAKKDGRKKR